MHTLNADFDLTAYASNVGTKLSGLDRHGASMLDAWRAWYAAVVAKTQIANLPSYLLADAFGEQASRKVDSHIRDGFGRPVY